MQPGTSHNHHNESAIGPSQDSQIESIQRRFLLAKDGLFSWKSMGGIFAALLVIGWIFIVVVLIQEEKWQLVLVSWLLLYAAAHFCYWYFRRHNLLPFTIQSCRRRRGGRTSVRPITKPTDLPPSYEDVIKSEHPPPAYCSVAIDESKCSSPKSQKFSMFSFESLSTVFGKSTPKGYHTKAKSSTPAQHMGRHVPSYNTHSLPPPPFSISQQLSNFSEEADEFPEMSLEARNYRSQLARQASSRSTRSSLIRRESITVNDSIAPILTPIYNNANGFSESPGTVPQLSVTSEEPSSSSTVDTQPQL